MRDVYPQFRQVFYKDEDALLATTFRIDDYYVVMNYAFNYTTKRTNYTKIYKKILGIFKTSVELEPVTWESDLPVCDFDAIIKLPFHNPTLLKSKLQLYTLFS